jgi:hypothetical protein
VALAALAVNAAIAFSIPPPPPTATTGAATQITYQSAVLAATVNPQGQATEVYFEYGTTTAYGTSSTQVAIPAGTKAVPVTITISSLTAFTTYDYRVFAVSANGTSKGVNRTFKTAKIPLTLAISAAPSPVNYNGIATIEGTLAGTGNVNRAVELQQTQFPYTAAFAQVGNTENTSATGAYSFIVPSIMVNTEYRVVNVANPLIVSPIVVEGCAVLATLHAKGIGTRSHPESKFSGTVTPGIETGAKFVVQKLNGTNWDLVEGGQTSPSAHNGVATFSVKVHFKHAGFFRVLVEPVEGAHVTGQSDPLYARGY